jgi:hypothetical protein
MMNLKYGRWWKRDKSRLFERKEICSIPQLLALLDDLRNDGYFFRGLPDSRYKIASSIQRIWHGGGCWKCANPSMTFPSFMCSLLDFARASDIFAFGRHCLMDHEIWAYLQHYGCPTPLLDFSTDPLVAAYFATANRRRECGYCSIYAFQPSGMLKGEQQDMMMLDEYLQNAFETDLEASVRNNQNSKLNLSQGFNYSVRNWRTSQFKHWGFWEAGHCVGEDINNFFELQTNGTAFFISKSSGTWCPRIAAGRMHLQDGLFVYAPIETMSLEDFIKLKNEKRNSDGSSDDLLYPKLKCFDIPPSLVDDLARVVEGDGISEATLGLAPCTEENAVKQMFGSYLNSLRGKPLS